jgi:hypothetical protein
MRSVSCQLHVSSNHALLMNEVRRLSRTPCMRGTHCHISAYAGARAAIFRAYMSKSTYQSAMADRAGSSVLRGVEATPGVRQFACLAVKRRQISVHQA